jgi:hypothetical protein
MKTRPCRVSVPTKSKLRPREFESCPTVALRMKPADVSKGGNTVGGGLMSNQVLPRSPSKCLIVPDMIGHAFQTDAIGCVSSSPSSSRHRRGYFRSYSDTRVKTENCRKATRS